MANLNGQILLTVDRETRDKIEIGNYIKIQFGEDDLMPSGITHHFKITDVVDTQVTLEHVGSE